MHWCVAKMALRPSETLNHRTNRCGSAKLSSGEVACTFMTPCITKGSIANLMTESGQDLNEFFSIIMHHGVER